MSAIQGCLLTLAHKTAPEQTLQEGPGPSYKRSWWAEQRSGWLPAAAWPRPGLYRQTGLPYPPDQLLVIWPECLLLLCPLSWEPPQYKHPKSGMTGKCTSICDVCLLRVEVGMASSAAPTSVGGCCFWQTHSATARSGKVGDGNKQMSKMCSCLRALPSAEPLDKSALPLQGPQHHGSHPPLIANRETEAEATQRETAVPDASTGSLSRSTVLCRSLVCISKGRTKIQRIKYLTWSCFEGVIHAVFSFDVPRAGVPSVFSLLSPFILLAMSSLAP